MRERLLVDLRPITDSRPYRILFLSQAGSLLGSQLTAVAVAYQTYLLTRSSLAVGLIGAAQLVPLIAGSLLGGVIADRRDRRTLLVLTSLTLCLLSALLLVNGLLAHPLLWPIYVLTALAAAATGMDLPTRRALMPGLITRDLYPASAALTALSTQIAVVAGPLLAGLAIAAAGVRLAYLIDTLTFLLALTGLLALRTPATAATAATAPGATTATGPAAGVAPAQPDGGWREAYAFLRRHRLLAACFGADAIAMIFGMPRAAFPALTDHVFHGGPHTLGLLYAAPGIGAVIGALVSGWTDRVTNPGHAVVAAIAIWGGAIALVGLVTSLALAVVLLAIAGTADVISEVFRSALLQLDVPDRLRGRMSALWIAQTTGSPRLGDAETGTVAAVTSAQFSVLTGGLAVLAFGGLLLLAVPALWTWQRPTNLPPNPEPPAPEHPASEHPKPEPA